MDFLRWDEGSSNIPSPVADPDVAKETQPQSLHSFQQFQAFYKRDT